MYKRQVKHLGYSKDVGKEIKEVDCVINPSYHEGMSNVLLESAAMAKPLIASDIPGCKEIVDDGNNGFLFKVKSAQSLKDKIVQFIDLSKDQKEDMGKESRRKIAKEFDRRIVINAYLEEINKIIWIYTISNELVKENVGSEKITVTGNTVIDALLDLVDDNYQFEDELLNDDQASNPYDVRVRQVSR